MQMEYLDMDKHLYQAIKVIMASSDGFDASTATEKIRTAFPKLHGTLSIETTRATLSKLVSDGFMNRLDADRWSPVNIRK